MKRVFILSICVCSILLFALTGCGTKKENGINEKLDAELQYIEDLIFKIANKYAKGEYAQEDKMNWEDIKKDIHKINASWNTLILDLTEVNVSNQEILGFSDHLNDLMIDISRESETAMMDQLNDMYAQIIVFKQAYSTNKNQIQKNKIKSEVLSIYSLVNKEEFEGAHAKAIAVIETYKGLMNDINYAEENSYNLNKIYVLLEEYRNSIQTRNYDLVRMKYILTVENL